MTDMLTTAEIETFSEIAGLMIPASTKHNLPGANDPAIMAEIVTDANTNAVEGVKQALAAWSGLSETSGPDRAAAFLETCAGHASLLQAVVNRVYYRTDAVMQSLGMEARAPFPAGYEVDEHDWSILDPVRAMGPIWRAAS